MYFITLVIKIILFFLNVFNFNIYSVDRACYPEDLGRFVQALNQPVLLEIPARERIWMPAWKRSIRIPKCGNMVIWLQWTGCVFSETLKI